MPKMAWNIHYDPVEEERSGYTEFSDLDGDPVDAWPYGVVAIAYRGERGRTYVIHGDWFHYNAQSGHWVAGSLHGLLDQLLRFPRFRNAVKEGRLIPNDAYRELMKRANADNLE